MPDEWTEEDQMRARTPHVYCTAEDFAFLAKARRLGRLVTRRTGCGELNDADGFPTGAAWGVANVKP